MFAMGCHHVKIRFYRVYFIGSSLQEVYGSNQQNRKSYRNLSKRFTGHISKMEFLIVILAINYYLCQGHSSEFLRGP